jgi:hypothetical protein
MDWYSIKYIADKCAGFSDNMIRNRLAKALENGMWPCVKRSNTSIFIHIYRFERWFEDNDCLVNELKKNGEYDYRLEIFKKDLKRSQEIYRGKV